MSTSPWQYRIDKSNNIRRMDCAGNIDLWNSTSRTWGWSICTTGQFLTSSPCDNPDMPLPAVALKLQSDGSIALTRNRGVLTHQELQELHTSINQLMEELDPAKPLSILNDSNFQVGTIRYSNPFWVINQPGIPNYSARFTSTELKTILSHIAKFPHIK